MENYEKLIAEIDEVVKQIKGLYDLAYTQYSHAVDEVISGRLTDEKPVSYTHLTSGSQKKFMTVLRSFWPSRA